MQNLTERIIKYEQGKLTEEQTIQLFQDLVDSGLVMHLQGHYGRFAAQLLEAGLITWQRLPAPGGTPHPPNVSP